MVALFFLSAYILPTAKLCRAARKTGKQPYASADGPREGGPGYLYFRSYSIPALFQRILTGITE